MSASEHFRDVTHLLFDRCRIGLIGGFVTPKSVEFIVGHPEPKDTVWIADVPCRFIELTPSETFEGSRSVRYSGATNVFYLPTNYTSLAPESFIEYSPGSGAITYRVLGVAVPSLKGVYAKAYVQAKISDEF